MSDNLIKNAQKDAQVWMDAFNKKDFAAVVGLYVEDGFISNPWWTAAGSAAMENAFRVTDEKLHLTLTDITVTDAKRFGDVEWRYGSWSGVTTAGKEMAAGGHWSALCRPQGDRCRWLNHVINLELPPIPMQ